MTLRLNYRCLLLASAFCGAASCSPRHAPIQSVDNAPAAAEAAKPAPRIEPWPIDPRFDSQLRQVAGTYQGWPRYNETPLGMNPMCSSEAAAAWAAQRAAIARLRHTSAAPAGSPHGGKLYWLHPSAVDVYKTISNGQDTEIPHGMAIVKATFESVPKLSLDNSFGEKESTLFVMYYAGVQEPGTDEGWIYATIEPTTRNIMSSGRIASCMECHARAPRKRLFGLKPLD